MCHFEIFTTPYPSPMTEINNLLSSFTATTEHSCCLKGPPLFEADAPGCIDVHHGACASRSQGASIQTDDKA